MKTLKDNINKLSLEELKTLLNKGKTRGIQYLILRQLIYLFEYGKINKIAEESFKLVKNKLDKDDLIYLSKYGTTDKIRKESKELLNIDEEFNINKYIEK